GMAAARRVGVRQLVDEDEPRMPLQDGVDVHLVEDAALVLDMTARDDLEPVEQRLGLLAAMRLDDADDDVEPLAALSLRRLQHREGLADPWCSAEEDLQAAAGFAGRLLEERLRRGARVAINALVGHSRHLAASPARQVYAGCYLAAIASSARLSFSTLTRGS